ncbi:MAG: hypothetical protein ACKVPX_10970 [Myxococcaceae bacterium]
MRERIQSALEVVVRSSKQEAAWLNTLSLLEFTGARKISRTVAAHHPSLDVLQHWADETRHAAVLKRLAHERLGAEPDEYLCLEAAKAYFADLDAALAEWLLAHGGDGNPLLNYLLVTTTVERRAMQLYPLYRAVTSDAQVREELSRIIVEEQSHRRAIEDRCRNLLAAGGLSFETPLAKEEALFDRFWEAVEKVLLLPVTPLVAVQAASVSAAVRS